MRLPDGRALGRDGFDAARERIRDEFAVYGKAYPLRWGPTRGELKARLARALDGALFDAALASLLAESIVLVRGDRVAEAPGRALVGKHAEAARKLLCTLEAAGSAPPELAGLLPTLGLPLGEAMELAGRLLADGDLVRIDADFVWARPAWSRAVEFVRAHFAHAPELTVAEIKEGLGISRKWAVPLLEALDRERITRREGNARVPGPAAVTEVHPAHLPRRRRPGRDPCDDRQPVAPHLVVAGLRIRDARSRAERAQARRARGFFRGGVIKTYIG